MLEIILVVLVILLLTGNIRISGFDLPHIVLLNINGQSITLVNILIFFLILWALGILPSPFREIAALLFVLWILSIFGIIAFAGLSNLIIIAIIVGIVFSIIKR
jgi:hypothetical protein